MSRPSKVHRRAPGLALGLPFRRRLGGIAAVVATLGLAGSCGGDPGGAADAQERGKVLADFGVLPDFSLTDQRGRPFTRADLDGRIWVADFIYTTCPSFCPRLSQDMRQLAYHYRDEPRVGFLSFTVDPERDTPEVQDLYADGYEADPERWYFLTGEKAAIYELMEKGFLLGGGEETADHQIPHSDRFSVVDPTGHLRAMPSKFLSEKFDEDFLGEVRHAVDLLLAGKGDSARRDLERVPPAGDGGSP